MKTIKIFVTLLLIGVVTLAQAQDEKKDDKKRTPAKKTMAGAKPKNVTNDKADKAKVEKTENKTDDKAKKTPAEIKKDKIEKSDKTGEEKKMKEIKRPVAKPR